MPKPKVGQILDPNTNYTRDAIHVPIMPVIAGDDLEGGDAVYLKDGKAYGFNGTFSEVTEKVVGVADPYLYLIEKGDKFYLFLKPESTSRLWHEWVHPLVDGKNK